MFRIIDSLSINNDVYFKADGSTTTDKNEALIVNSIKEGDKLCRENMFTIYQPIYEPI